MDLLHERKKIILAAFVSLKLIPIFNHQNKSKQSVLYYLLRFEVSLVTLNFKKFKYLQVNA